MASIEDRIVQMSFDNTAFERKMSTTIQSLEKLNSTLATAGQRNGLQNIAHSVRDFNFGPLSSSIDGISAKFLALSTVAITALSNIVNRAVDAGIRIAKAFTLDPLTSGFSEYETQIGSIQTILANTQREGTNLGQVNAALDELNRYSDRTIYNFGEMARNIGTFTAAGIDLDTSVTAIQGIANLAAISGSNSQQASTAMYQLSQALSTGSVRLMDWNSVVNAGMGGELFQRALFDTGQAMGTIADAPLGTSFDEWTEAGEGFRLSLDSGWLSADVLTTTLGALSGQMTEAQLVAAGFTTETAQQMLALGESGIDAATKVRTFSQLMQTVKEAIGSGWSQSFRLIFGNFEEATDLFTNVSNSIGGFVGRNADARNTLLQTWKDMGGRTRLLWALGSGFKSLRIAMAPIKQAFREVFPAMTANRLVDLTKSFGRFMVAIRPGTQTIVNMKKIFEGLFSALKIGWTVIREGAGFIINLFKSLTGAGGGGFLTFLGKIGEAISNFRETLVDGGGIAAFFDGLTASLEEPLAIFDRFKKKIGDLFTNLKLPRGITEFLDAMGRAFNKVGSASRGVGDIWAPLRTGMSGLGSILSSAWDALSDFFSGLGDRIANIFSGDSFAGVLDTIDTGLLGGIAVLIAKFLGGGLNLDFGGGLFGNISQSFNELSGVLSAMQTNLKANALLKIAGAVGILAVSLALIASIDSDKMSDALGTLAIGFGQLIAAFLILNQAGIGPKDAAAMNLIASSMLIMAGAVLVLSAAVKIFSMLTWEELAKGLVGVAGALGLLVGASILMSKFSGSMIRAGIGMMAMAIALGIMAGVVKLFSMMEWSEMAKGLVGVVGALAAMAIGMRLMPKGMLLQGAGLLLIAVALNAIAGAMKVMATMSWEDMGKGLAGIAGALVAIGLATKLMGPELILTAAGLLLVSVALGGLVAVMMAIATMSWEEIAKGLVGIAGALVAIGIAATIASGSLAGAVGLSVMMFSLSQLVDVLERVARMSWGDLIKGFVGLAGGMAILGLAALLLAPAALPLLAFGAALTLLGAGIALAGVGILAISKGFALLAKVGARGIAVLIKAITDFAEALPGVLKDVAEGILQLVETILGGLPEIIGMLGAIIGAILDVIIENVPKAAEAIRVLVTELLATARSLFPDVVQTGFDLILALLKGIRDNIPEIVTVVADIITGFLDALALKIPDVIDSMYNFLVAVVEGVVEKIVDLGSYLVPKGLELIQGLIKGIDDNKGKIGDFFIALPGLILGWIGDAASWLAGKGADLISGLYNAASSWMTTTVFPWFQSLPGLIWDWIGDTSESLALRGKNIVVGFYNAAASWVTSDMIPWFKSIPGKIWGWVGDTSNSLALRGKNIIVGFINAAVTFTRDSVIPWFQALASKIWAWVGDTSRSLASRGLNIVVGFINAAVVFTRDSIIPWFKALPGKIVGWIGDTLGTLSSTGYNIAVGLINGVVGFMNSDVIPWFQAIPGKIRSWVGSGWSILNGVGSAIATGLRDGISGTWHVVTDWISNAINSIPGWVKGLLGIGSPSKVFREIGGYTMEGFYVGLKDGWKKTETWMSHLDPGKPILQGPMARMSDALAKVSDELTNMDEFNPVVTPVLDLTRIREEAGTMAGLLTSTEAYTQARRIASTALLDREAPAAQDASGSTEIKFEQNNYSPKALTTGDIYRQTRSQIALAKEELAIP